MYLECPSIDQRIIGRESRTIAMADQDTNTVEPWGDSTEVSDFSTSIIKAYMSLLKLALGICFYDQPACTGNLVLASSTESTDSRRAN